MSGQDFKHQQLINHVANQSVNLLDDTNKAQIENMNRQDCKGDFPPYVKNSNGRIGRRIADSIGKFSVN